MAASGDAVPPAKHSCTTYRKSVCFQAATSCQRAGGELLLGIILPSHSCLCWLMPPKW